MPYEMVFSPAFTRCIKALRKRFPTVKRDVELAIEILLENPTLGSVIPGTTGVRKLRVRNSDLIQGKSGGYRMLYYIEDHQSQRLYLLLLYAKSDQGTVSLREIQKLIGHLG
jgi:mRNA-degrading endonuclease RelE of RelBE toxin-antitoxin system